MIIYFIAGSIHGFPDSFIPLGIHSFPDCLKKIVSTFGTPLRQMKRDFVLDNDLGGGDFTVDSRSSGKYWIDILEPGGDENWIDIDQIKSSTVIDESKKKELIRVLESATEDSNPILMIATLK